MGKSRWPGLAREQCYEIGARYERACRIVVDRAQENNPGDHDRAAAEFVELRRGMRVGLGAELRSLGCQDSEIPNGPR